MPLTIQELAQRLEELYGDPQWWPADTPFEVAVGAILTQNTAWTNVETAIANLRSEQLLSPSAIQATDPMYLQTVIRSSGYFRQKSWRLRRLANWWSENVPKDGPAALMPSDTDLRRSLLSIKGIGPETADTILLYAFERPVFVVDAYTARLITRLGLLTPPFSYDELQMRFTDELPLDVSLFSRLHAQIVEHGKQLCSKQAPNCDRCALRPSCYGPERDEAG